MERKKVLSLLCVGFMFLGNLVAPLTTVNAEVSTSEIPNSVSEFQMEDQTMIDTNQFPIDSTTDKTNFAPPEEKEPEAEVFVESENYDLATMKLKSSEIGIAEDGGTIENDLFEFEAFIKESDIKDGTAPFDSDNEAGNDSSSNNGVVRTFDNLTYPLKITINPKKVDKLNKIVLKISGTLENGVTNNRVNARYSIGGTENIETGLVSFEQLYTIEQTGNSVMIPISIDVQGAENGIVLRPNINVQVISVEGKDLTSDNIVTEFNKLPSVKTSGKVNIKAILGRDFSVQRTLTRITGEESDDFIYGTSVSFGVDKLSNKTDMRGATLPSGKINYSIELSGKVIWDKSGAENLDFDNRDTPLKLFDYQPVMPTSRKTGNPNTEMAGKDYNDNSPLYYSARSQIIEYQNPKNVTENSDNSVWESGEYLVEKSTMTKSAVKINGSFSDYVIGSTFPLYRSDSWRGAMIYGIDEKIFSTQSFLIQSPNEYRQGGKNNSRNESNNVYNYFKLNVESYEDSNGEKHDVGKSYSYTMVERNNMAGSLSVQNTFYSITGRDLGSSILRNAYGSTGDPSALIGEDVKFYSGTSSTMILHGGYATMFKWNVDSFELTETYAEETTKRIYSRGYYNKDRMLVANNKEKQTISFGVPRNKNMSFEKLTRYTKDDYEWYNSYNEARSHGEVGAILNDISDVTGRSSVYNQISLRVKTKNIGSLNENGTPNIALTSVYAYGDDKRTSVYELDKSRPYNNHSEYNELGEMTKMQSPVGSGINFETLGILNAEVASQITTDKATYYNSEEVRWTINSSMLLPLNASLESENSVVELKQILPKGLDYKIGSGKIGSTQNEPKVIKNTDGTTTIVWEILLSANSTKIDGISFSTTINPFALTSGVQSSLTVKNIISFPLDTRSEKLRTASRSINVLKVGMVGIYENIDVDNGEKNSSFTVRMKPYTTIEDELDVKGLTVIPLNGDKLGSVYQGSAFLEGIEVASKKPVSIYLNNSIVESNKPNQIDLTKNGWYKYTGKDQDISKALSLLFHVEGVLANTDDVEIAFKVKTKDNNFGNIYYNETVINSATDYKLSPISNKVKYTIRADVELNLERIQIYTSKADSKLPVKLRVNKEILRDRSADEPLKLVLYEQYSNVKVFEKAITIDTLTRENELEIPAKYLEKNTNRSYEARIEGYNTDRIYVKEEADKIDTLGYTASEKTLEKQAVDNAPIEYKGVIMTERVLGKEIEMYYETINLPIKQLSPIKAGYGFSLDQQLDYTNDLTTKDVTLPTMAVVADSKVVDGDFYNSNNGKSTIELLEKSSYIGNKITQTYSFPEVYVKSGSGDILSQEQYQSSEDISNIVSGGNKVYVPIWIESLGSYDYQFKTKEPIGINAVKVVVSDTVTVDAFMYGHIGSETIQKDEILITPIDLKNPFSGNLPEGWTETDVDWLQSN